MTLLKITLNFLILATATVSTAAIADDEIANKVYLICKNKKEVRTMRVQVGGDGLCRAYYAKVGVEKSVGSGRNVESCVGFVNGIKTNLEKSDWNCRDISDTKITAAAE